MVPLETGLAEDAPANRHLRINYQFYEKAETIGGMLEGTCRPSKAARSLRHKIEEDVVVDQYSRHSVIAGQSHDRIGAHRNIAAATQMSDKAAPRPSLSLVFARTIRRIGISNPLAGQSLRVNDVK